MDALEHLAEKNRKHKKLLKKERKADLLVIPFMLVGLAVYAFVIVFVADFDGVTKQSELTEMSRQVWVLSTIFFFGLGAFFVASEFVYTLFVERLAKLVGSRVRSFSMVSACLRKLLLGAFFAYIGIWFDSVIYSNKKQIAEFMRFGFDSTPFILEALITFMVIFIGLIISMAFVSLFFIPSLAEEQAKELRKDPRFRGAS